MKDFNKYLFLFLLASASIVTLVALNIGNNPNYYVQDRNKLTAGMDAIFQYSCPWVFNQFPEENLLTFCLDCLTKSDSVLACGAKYDTCEGIIETIRTQKEGAKFCEGISELNCVKKLAECTGYVDKFQKYSKKEGDSCTSGAGLYWCDGRKLLECINGEMILIKLCQADCASYYTFGALGWCIDESYSGYCDESAGLRICSNNSVMDCIYDKDDVRRAFEIENCSEKGEVCVTYPQGNMGYLLASCEIIDPKVGDKCKANLIRCNKNNEFCTCSNGRYVCSKCPGNNTCIENQGCVNLVGNGNNCSKIQEGKLSCNATADTVCKCNNGKWKCDRPCASDQVCNDSIKTYCVSKGGGGGACKGGKNCDFTQ